MKPKLAALDPQYNPFDEYRAGQQAAILSIYSKIVDGVKFIALLGPTGTGKSIIAASIGNLVGGSNICTTQIGLQEQYDSMGENFQVTKGRRNFICRRTGRGCDQGLCTKDTDFKCKYAPKNVGKFEAFANRKWESGNIEERCNYWKNVERGARAKHTIFNYPYYVLKMNSPVKDFEYRDLQILDEGHNIEEYIRSIASIELHDVGLFHVRYVDRVDDIEWVEFDKVPVKTLTTIEKTTEWLYQLLDVIRTRLLSTEDYLIQFRHDIDMKQRSRRLESLRAKIQSVLDDYRDRPNNWVLECMDDGIKLIPLEIQQYAGAYLFSLARTTLIMSATLPRKEVLCRRLGIEESDMYYYSVDSTFPPENSPIFLHAQPTMSYNAGGMGIKRDRMGKLLLSQCNTYHDKKGLILVNSFNEVDHYEEYFREHDYNTWKRLTIHTRADRMTELVREHTAKDASILLTPSGWEGLDLPGCAAEFNLLAKVPYPDMKSPTVKGLIGVDKSRYFEDTVLKILQGIGRGVRSTNDKCDIHINDGAIRRLYRYNRRDFPEYVQNRVVLV